MAYNSNTSIKHRCTIWRQYSVPCLHVSIVDWAWILDCIICKSKSNRETLLKASNHHIPQVHSKISAFKSSNPDTCPLQPPNQQPSWQIKVTERQILSVHIQLVCSEYGLMLGLNWGANDWGWWSRVCSPDVSLGGEERLLRKTRRASLGSCIVTQGLDRQPWPLTPASTQLYINGGNFHMGMWEVAKYASFNVVFRF